MVSSSNQGIFSGGSRIKGGSDQQNAREIFKTTPTFTLTTPIFDQIWPTLAPPGPLLYLRAAINSTSTL